MFQLITHQYHNHEQTMMEMKIRLIAEQQQKSRKNLLDRDEYWQSKVRDNFAF